MRFGKDYRARNRRIISPRMGSPMAMSLNYLRKLGYYAEDVEQTSIRYEGSEHAITRDLLGFADIIALKDHVLLVQTTSYSNIAARVKKIQAAHAFPHCKRAGVLIHVHGWSEQGLRIVDMAGEVPDYSAMLRKKHKGHLVTQKDLGL